jgi:hypothetical protein
MAEDWEITHFEFKGEDEACFNDLCACGHGLDQHGNALGMSCAVDACACDEFVE